MVKERLDCDWDILAKDEGYRGSTFTSNELVIKSQTGEESFHITVSLTLLCPNIGLAGSTGREQYQYLIQSYLPITW